MVRCSVYARESADYAKIETTSQRLNPIEFLRLWNCCCHLLLIFCKYSSWWHIIIDIQQKLEFYTSDDFISLDFYLYSEYINVDRQLHWNHIFYYKNYKLANLNSSADAISIGEKNYRTTFFFDHTIWIHHKLKQTHILQPAKKKQTNGIDIFSHLYLQVSPWNAKSLFFLSYKYIFFFFFFF